MRHLFVAPLVSAYGETLHAIRIARGVVAAGHEVVFAAPAALHGLVTTAPVLFGRIDRALQRLDVEIALLIRQMGCDSLVLVDAAAVGKTVNVLGLDPRAFTEPGVPVVALDCWNLPRDPVAWDYGDRSEVLPAAFHHIERRLVPVPSAAPDVDGGFRALPALGPLPDEVRAQIRAALGVRDDDRLIVWPTATWQHPQSQTGSVVARRAAELPARILPLLAGLDPRVRIAHVGPEPFPDAPACYRHVPRLTPERFEAVIQSADLLVSFNAVASSIATAIAARVPIVLGASAAPPVHVWPLGLDAVVAPMLADNPLLGALRRVDISDEAAYVEACRALLFDATVADELRARQAEYARRVHALPAGHERLLASF